MADIDRRKEVDRGLHAAEVLNNALVKEAFETLERELTEQLCLTAADNEEKRKNIHMLLLAGRRFKSYFNSMVETGKLASLQLEDKRKLRLWG